MIVGETLEFARVVMQTIAFTATAPSVSILKPDGTTATPTVTATPGTSAATQTLTCLFTPPLGGIYRLTWQYTDALGEIISLIDMRYATFTDAPGLIRNRLVRTDSDYPDTVLESEIASIARALLSDFPQIGNGIGTAATFGLYYLLSDPNDQAFFDEAVGLMVAARLIGPQINSGNSSSDLIQQKDGDEANKFADTGRDRNSQLLAPGDRGAGPGGYGGQNERERWLREAAQSFGQVAVIHQSFAAGASSRRMFSISGPTRSSKASGDTQTLWSSIVRLFNEAAPA